MSKRYRLVIDGPCGRRIWTNGSVDGLVTVGDVQLFLNRLSTESGFGPSDLAKTLDGPDVETIDVEVQEWDSAPFVPVRRIKGPQPPAGKRVDRLYQLVVDERHEGGERYAYRIPEPVATLEEALKVVIKHHGGKGGPTLSLDTTHVHVDQGDKYEDGRVFWELVVKIKPRMTPFADVVRGDIDWPAPGSNNTYIPSFDTPHLVVDAADLPDEVVGKPVKDAIRGAAERLRTRGINKFSEIKPMDPSLPVNFRGAMRQTAASALRSRVEALRRAAAELEALAPLADTLVSGSPAEAAFWSLLSAYRPNG